MTDPAILGQDQNTCLVEIMCWAPYYIIKRQISITQDGLTQNGYQLTISNTNNFWVFGKILVCDMCM